VRQRDVAKLVGKAVHRPGVMPAPAFGVKLVAGEFAEVILNGRRVVPAKLKQLGFAFAHADLAASARRSRVALTRRCARPLKALECDPVAHVNGHTHDERSGGDRLHVRAG